MQTFFNHLVARAIPWAPRALVRRISRRYIAGDTLAEALARVHGLNQQGFAVTLDLLGESAADMAAAQATAAECAQVLQAVHAAGVQATLSIKPTALGLLVDAPQCAALIEGLVQGAARWKRSVCMDMEDVACTQLEIDLFRRLRTRYANVELALQAYLTRTAEDLDQLLREGAGLRLRLCKGIYPEEPRHLVPDAGADRGAINPHFLRHVARCFDAGVFVAVATHDAALIEQVLALSHRHGVGRDRFEFQMLLGVCEPLRDRLRAQGFPVRIYVPFGPDWYGYSTRRLKENPRLAGQVLRALVRR